MYIRHRWRLIDVEMTSCSYWVCRDFSAQLFWIANAEAVARRCFVPKLFWKILQNSEKNTCARDSFLIKFQEPLETLVQMFSCEFYEIFNNTFFMRTPLAAAPANRCSEKNAVSKCIVWETDLACSRVRNIDYSNYIFGSLLSVPQRIDQYLFYKV